MLRIGREKELGSYEIKRNRCECSHEGFRGFVEAPSSQYSPHELEGTQPVHGAGGPPCLHR